MIKSPSYVYKAAKRVLRSGQFILGKELELLEEEVSDLLNVDYAIGVNSGTDALFLSLKALGIGAGDEVITTPFSFISTASSIANVGAIPVFVDIGEDLNINIDLIEEKITSKTKAILPVHLFGQRCNMLKIMEIAKKYDLWVIEDACQAFGIDLIGDAAAISFYPTKILGACGDAGMIVTDNAELDRKLRILRNNGSAPNEKYLHLELGYNSRLDEIQAAILREKLKHIDYDFEYDKNKYYPKCIHLQPAFKYLGYAENSMPVAEKEALRVKNYV